MADVLRILMLEDSKADAELIQCELLAGGVKFVALRVDSEAAFTEQLDRFAPTLILSDYSLPGFNGLAALKIAQARHPEIPFLFVSGTLGEEVAIETLKSGATDYVIKNRLKRLVSSVERAVREVDEKTRRRKAEEHLERSNAELLRTYDATLEGWSRALDLRDKGTEGHSLRVKEITVRVARWIGFSEEALVHIARGAFLHDIGKMGIPDCVLLKPGPLDPQERAIMNRHPDYAHALLFPIEYLRPALTIPYAHHEKWDGSGYPRGLKGEEIPLEVRLFSVVDVWDALCSDRPYHTAWPPQKVAEHIRSLSGTHFDPAIVGKFLAFAAKHLF